jgi:altronate dehydratase
MPNALRIHADDNVVVATQDLAEETPVEWATGENAPRVTTSDAIPFGHKIAIVTIPRGEPVIKYGASIGLAVRDIMPGEHVHVHNLRSVRGAALNAS